MAEQPTASEWLDGKSNNGPLGGSLNGFSFRNLRKRIPTPVIVVGIIAFALWAEPYIAGFFGFVGLSYFLDDPKTALMGGIAIFGLTIAYVVYRGKKKTDADRGFTDMGGIASAAWVETLNNQALNRRTRPEFSIPENMLAKSLRESILLLASRSDYAQYEDRLHTYKTRSEDEGKEINKLISSVGELDVSQRDKMIQNMVHFKGGYKADKKGFELGWAQFDYFLIYYISAAQDYLRTHGSSLDVAQIEAHTKNIVAITKAAHTGWTNFERYKGAFGADSEIQSRLFTLTELFSPPTTSKQKYRESPLIGQSKNDVRFKSPESVISDLTKQWERCLRDFESNTQGTRSATDYVKSLNDGLNVFALDDKVENLNPGEPFDRRAEADPGLWKGADTMVKIGAKEYPIPRLSSDGIRRYLKKLTELCERDSAQAAAQYEYLTQHIPVRNKGSQNPTPQQPSEVEDGN